MTTKKIICIAFIILVALCLCACGGQRKVDGGRIIQTTGQGFGQGELTDTYNEGWGDFTGPQARQKFINEDVYFPFDSTVLSPEARANLDMKAKWMEVNSGVFVIIEGHCDNRGTAEYNLALGEARANSIRNYMIALGIAPNRLEVVSYGEERPVVDGDGEAAWSLNRRGHFAIPQ